jgi:hypothetical protein
MIKDLIKVKSEKLKVKSEDKDLWQMKQAEMWLNGKAFS